MVDLFRQEEVHGEESADLLEHRSSIPFKNSFYSVIYINKDQSASLSCGIDSAEIFIVVLLMPSFIVQAAPLDSSNYFSAIASQLIISSI